MKTKLIFLFLILTASNASALTIKVSKDSENDTTLTAFAKEHGYSPIIINENTLEESPNPESELDFASRKIREFVKESACTYEINQKSLLAKQTETPLAKEMNVVRS